MNEDMTIDAFADVRVANWAYARGTLFTANVRGASVKCLEHFFLGGIGCGLGFPGSFRGVFFVGIGVYLVRDPPAATGEHLRVYLIFAHNDTLLS